MSIRRHAEKKYDDEPHNHSFFPALEIASFLHFACIEFQSILFAPFFIVTLVSYICYIRYNM